MASINPQPAHPLTSRSWQVILTRYQIYNYTFALADDRGDRALRIERRHLKHFKPSAAAILLLLHHEYFLLNRLVAREALSVLFAHHTVFLSCGPYVLLQILTRIADSGAPGQSLLRRLARIELDWVTFPNLRIYPPERADGKDEWWWEHDPYEVDVDYVRGAPYNAHYDEHDHEGDHYDDNFYGADDAALYPVWPRRNPPAAAAPAHATDPFGFASHYPFADPLAQPAHDVAAASEIDSKLELLVSLEVTPLFDYLFTPAFALQSLTLPLYFLSKASHANRSATRPGYTLPLKIRYWVHNLVHALLALRKSPTLAEVRVKYMPWDIWASMEPADDLQRIVSRGVWFRAGEGRTGEGEAFRAVWAGLQGIGALKGDDRMGLEADVRFVKWEGDLDKWRVGDELEVVFRKGAG